MEQQEIIEQPRFSGKLESILNDGTIIYDGKKGKPNDFPLTEAELKEVQESR